MNRIIACMLLLSATACASDESTRNHSTTVRAHDAAAARHHREGVAENSIDEDLDADHRGHERVVIPAERAAVKPVAVAPVPAQDVATADGRPVAGDQTASDRELTRRVRKAVDDDNRLSPAAKNAKIVTKDGRVTLQGSVPNDAEKAAVDSHARDVVGASNVDNELVVR